MRLPLPTVRTAGSSGLLCAVLATAAALPFSMAPVPRIAVGLGAFTGGVLASLIQEAACLKLQRSQAGALQEFAGNAADCALTVSPDLQVLHVSRGAVRYDMDPAGIRGRMIREVFPAETSEVIANVVDMAIRSADGVSPTATAPIQLPRGDSRQFEITAYQLRPATAPLLYVLLRDVTALQAVRTGMTQFERQAAVAQLAAGVAHNFNNILAGIMLNVSLMVDAEGEELLHLSDRIIQSADRGAALSRNLLTFARGQVPALGPVAIHPLLADVVLLFETEAHRRGIRLLWEADPALVALGDRSQIQQILISLLFNARDAIGDAGMIRISATRKGDQAQIDVANNGHPIRRDHLPLIFLPFFSTRGGTEHGAGLGLPVCLTLARGMGGTITVKSPPEGETIFSLVLPGASSHEVQAGSEAGRSAHSGR
jgi:signal transduction histidine kinase